MRESVHPVDSEIHGERYATEEMRAIFSEAGKLRSWLRFEAALARAEGDLGLIPREAAGAIEAAATTDRVSVERVRDVYVEIGLDTAAFVRVLSAACPPDAGGYVHWGATTTDILDTGMSIQLKEALELILQDVDRCQEILAGLIERHRDTLLVGRTCSQHALPITLGFKLALWLDDLTGHVERLRGLQNRLLVAKVSGAAGTHASFGPAGLALQAAVAAALGLAPAPMCIQTSHAHVQEFLSTVALLGNTLAQIARDIWNRQRPEIGEMAEPFAVGRQVGSSTLAGKRNPLLCEWTIGQATMLRSNAAALLSVVAEDERDGTRFPVDYAVVGDSCCLADAMLSRTQFVLRGLIVDTDRMRANLELSRGVVLAEAAMMALARRGIGRQAAYSLVYKAAHGATDRGTSLEETLWEDATIRERFTRDELARVLDPANYLGTASEQVDQAVARWQASRQEGRLDR